ncbi:MAG: hypothetical protein KAU02_04655 [Tenericutes bacterium]|nr:hypothetical protein [Mycoplasmatota bacterium]
MDRLKNLWKTITDLFENNRRVFCHLATRASFGLLFFFGLVFPFFKVKYLFLTNIINAFDVFLGWIWVLVFLVLPIAVLLLSLTKKEKNAKQLFKATTIFAIIFYIWLLLVYIVAATDSTLPTVNIGFGFFLTTLALAGLVLLTWKQELIMNFIYKLFKIPEVQEVEYVEETPVEKAPVTEEKV